MSCTRLMGSFATACLIPLACAALTAGCAMSELKADLPAYDATRLVVGRVDMPSNWAGPVIVAAYSDAPGDAAITSGVRLSSPGEFELLAPQGPFHLIAFGEASKADTNAGTPPCGESPVAPGEGRGASAPIKPFVIEAGTEAWRCQLPGAARNAIARATPPRTRATRVIGWDDTSMSSASSRVGYWQPARFLREQGSQVVFLQPYDPAKVPVLFVAGAAGSPADWRVAIAHLDRDRFQPWLLSYPSGASLDQSADGLAWELQTLQARYHFETLCIAAHSMGGLLARELLARYAVELPQIKLLVTLSTPWAGDGLAEVGTMMSPAVVPSWRDLDPNGPFLAHLFERPLPQGVTHHLFFSYRQARASLRDSTDGTVTLASQLRPAAQLEAATVVGFDEDHVSILSSPQMIVRLNAALAEFDRRHLLSEAHVAIGIRTPP